MSKLREKVLELAEISKECPENLQVVCFELLLRHHLESISPKPSSKAAESPPLPASTPLVTGLDTTGKQDKPDDVAKGQDDIAESDLHIKARHFMKKLGVSIEQLNNLYYKDDGKIAPLYEDLKTTRVAEGQVRIALLQALQKAMSTGEFQASVEEIRAEANARKCYDKGNFAANFNNNASLFDFEKYDKTTSSVKLSEDGKKELAEVIKELQ
jgi:hypothetical protein